MTLTDTQREMIRRADRTGKICIRNSSECVDGKVVYDGWEEVVIGEWNARHNRELSRQSVSDVWALVARGCLRVFGTYPDQTVCQPTPAGTELAKQLTAETTEGK